MISRWLSFAPALLLASTLLAACGGDDDDSPGGPSDAGVGGNAGTANGGTSGGLSGTSGGVSGTSGGVSGTSGGVSGTSGGTAGTSGGVSGTSGGGTGGTTAAGSSGASGTSGGAAGTSVAGSAGTDAGVGGGGGADAGGSAGAAGSGGEAGSAGSEAGGNAGAAAGGQAQGGQAQGGQAQGGQAQGGQSQGGQVQGGQSQGGQAQGGQSQGGQAQGGQAQGGTSSAGTGGSACVPPNPCDSGDDTPKTPVCSPSATWGTGTPVAGLPTSGDRRLVSLTPDERVLAWSEGASLRVASRAVASDAFGAAQTVTLPKGYGSDLRGSLSPDGLRLVLGRDDRLALAQVTRATLAQTFTTTADEVPFAEVNKQAQLTGWPVRSPLIARADGRLYFMSHAPGAIGRMFVARRGGPNQIGSGNVDANTWGVGSALNTSAFSGGAPDQGLLPTGAPSDGASLFVFDEVASSERAIWSSHIGSDVDADVNLTPRRWAAPNAACTRLYYSAPDGAGFAILVADSSPLASYPDRLSGRLTSARWGEKSDRPSGRLSALTITPDRARAAVFCGHIGEPLSPLRSPLDLDEDFLGRTRR